MANTIPRKPERNGSTKIWLVHELHRQLNPSNPIALVLQHLHYYHCRKGTRVPPCPFGELNQLPEHICLSKQLKTVICHYCSVYTTFRTLGPFVYSAPYDYVIALMWGGWREPELGEESKEAELHLFSQFLLDINSLKFNPHPSKQS